MSNLAIKIKKFYDMGIYTQSQVHDFYVKGKITFSEYEEIVG